MSPKEFVPIFLIICLGLILSMAAVWEYWVQNAYGDFIPYIGFKIAKENPGICMIEPSDVKVKNYINVTLMALETWHNKLENATGNKTGWDMTYYLILNSTHFNKTQADFPFCNVFIMYEKLDSSAGGYAAFNYTNPKHKYADIVLNAIRTYEQPIKGSNATLKLTLTVSQEEAYQIIMHEFGHVLGLGHYNSTTNKDSLNHNDSIMTWQMPEKFKPDYTVTNNDISAVLGIYGKDGFGGDTPVKTKSYIID